MVLAARPKRKVRITGTITIASTDGWTSRAFKNYHYRGMRITVNRSEETGTATLNGKVQYKSGNGNWLDLQSASFIEWADGATGERSLTLFPGMVGSDADSKVALNTNLDVHVGQPAPMEWRLVLTTTGTTNVVAAGVEYFN